MKSLTEMTKEEFMDYLKQVVPQGTLFETHSANITILDFVLYDGREVTIYLE
jgi:hypothetical protein